MEYDWAAAHYDTVLGGDTSAYLTRNSKLIHYTYALGWSVIQNDSNYQDLVNYFAAHGYDLESAFLHNSGTSKTQGNRKTFTIWDSARWAYNPSYVGLVEWQKDRLLRLVGGPTSRERVFFDEYGWHSFKGYVCPSLEYTDCSDTTGYIVDHNNMMAQIRAVLGKPIMLNTAQNTSQVDLTMTEVAGAFHGEGLDTPKGHDIRDSWRFMDLALSKGVISDLASVDPREYTWMAPGMYNNYRERVGIFELVAYYMVVPNSPDLAVWHMNPLPSLRDQTLRGGFKGSWLEANQVDIGTPLGVRYAVTAGIYRRDFTRAIVLLRVNSSGDWNTAYTVSLGGTFRFLDANGTTGGSMTSIGLRQGEAAIFMKR